MITQDFRAQRSLGKSEMEGWLKHIGKLGLPVQLLMRVYQLAIMYLDLVFMCIFAVKEMLLSVFFAVIPLPKKHLTSEVAIVSKINFFVSVKY